MPQLKIENLTAIVDTREQTPWDLSPMQTQPGTLSTGDYSIKGLERVVAIERKSLMDFVACCGRERERFQRELDRLRGWSVSAVIIESTWQAIEQGEWKTPQMKMTPAHVLGSLTSWIAQGHTIIVAPREMAQRIARSVLQHAAAPAARSERVDTRSQHKGKRTMSKILEAQQHLRGAAFFLEEIVSEMELANDGKSLSEIRLRLSTTADLLSSVNQFLERAELVNRRMKARLEIDSEVLKQIDSEITK